MVSKKEIINDIRFCKELLNRLEKYIDKNYTGDLWTSKHTVIQNDIIRIRRELNETKNKLNWNYNYREEK